MVSETYERWQSITPTFRRQVLLQHRGFSAQNETLRDGRELPTFCIRLVFMWMMIPISLPVQSVLLQAQLPSSYNLERGS